VPRGQQYPVGMVLRFVALVLDCGTSLRSGAAVLELFGHPTGPHEVTPHASTGRLWLMRIGLWSLLRPKVVAEDWAWMADHSIQIGKCKCLVILGIRLSILPAGRPLRHEDMEPIALVPMTSSTKDTSTDTGDVIQGPLSNDATARTVMAQIRSTLMGSATGLPGTATYSSTGSLGIKTATDGTLSLDTTIFQAALDKDPDAVKKVFTLSGTSTNGAVSMSSGGSKTMTGGVDFNITNYVSGGAVAGTFTVGGTSYNLSGSNGSLVGAAGTPLEGLSLSVSGKGTGTLNISRGVGQTLQDLVLSLTSYTGSMELAQTNITNENKDLSDRIDSGQALLDKRQTVLKNQFAKMESDLSQMRALSSSLSGA